MQRRWLFVLALLIGTGCTHRVWFTHELRESFELGLHDAVPGGEAGLGGEHKAHSPNELQYFVSQRIVLEREISSRADKLKGGRVVVRRGKFIERVVVRRGTPGVAVDWGPDWVAVSFEKGTRLVFERTESSEASAPEVDRAPAGFFGDSAPKTTYRLRTTPHPDGHGVGINFNGKTYRPAANAESARLKVRRNARTDRDRSRRVLRGRRI